MTTNARKLSTNQEARKNLKAQLAEYLSRQPESTLAAHKWMKRVEAAGLGIILAAFAAALYGSFAWGDINPAWIPVAWFIFATCFSLMAMSFGLHVILIRAFPPVILPGKQQKFVTGTTAIWKGAFSLAGGVIVAGFWIAFAYTTATFNLAMIVPLVNIFGVIVTIGTVLSIAFAIYQKATRSR